MDDNALADALARGERALDRIERAHAAMNRESKREEALREKVRAVVAELDDMLGAAHG